MKITWVVRSFLDYRIPVYAALNQLCGDNLTVIYYKDVVPDRCQEKLASILGQRAIGLTGEFRIGGKKNQPISSSVKKKGIRIPIQPQLIKITKSTDPDLLISDGFFQWTYAPLWLHLFTRIPHIMMYEGTVHTERNASRLRILYRKLASKYIDIIHCNGSLSHMFLTKVLKINTSKLALGNMTADIETLESNCYAFTENERLTFKQELNLVGPIFLFVGRIVPVKGIEYLLDSWKTMNTHNLNLLIIGDGEQKKKLSEYAQHNELKNVSFKGNAEHDILYKYYAISDCFIIPTLQDNWSLVVPEAMSCGLPILSSKYNGCWPEFVKPENGWVFDPLDKTDFIHTFKQAIANQDNWKDMGKSSQKIIREFSPNKIASSIYDSCYKLTTRD